MKGKRRVLTWRSFQSGITDLGAGGRSQIAPVPRSWHRGEAEVFRRGFQVGFRPPSTPRTFYIIVEIVIISPRVD